MMARLLLALLIVIASTDGALYNAGMFLHKVRLVFSDTLGLIGKRALVTVNISLEHSPKQSPNLKAKYSQGNESSEGLNIHRQSALRTTSNTLAYTR
eukprot:CAMPEP_0178727090 /NCGR_PEP_ID=MMETSP0699-20121125/27675_1 /TAXON_ID=265572 /ORGANISM="Extubocellulus spinifer, Strain CCMP396" /LENGTH=96 /DNA_ID=CAMNT_0020378775 /DNA_START=233 /DNA_END=523 /DNA_ORIENTATION=-